MGGLQPGGRIQSHDPAAIHDRDPAAELICLLHVVSRQKDRDALLRQLGHHLPDAAGHEPPGKPVEPVTEPL